MFEDLGWERVISLVAPENTRSIRLAERLGERPEGEATVCGFSVAVYAIMRGQWRAT